MDVVYTEFPQGRSIVDHPSECVWCKKDPHDSELFRLSILWARGLAVAKTCLEGKDFENWMCEFMDLDENNRFEMAIAATADSQPLTPPAIATAANILSKSIQIRKAATGAAAEPLEEAKGEGGEVLAYAKKLRIEGFAQYPRIEDYTSILSYCPSAQRSDLSKRLLEPLFHSARKEDRKRKVLVKILVQYEYANRELLLRFVKEIVIKVHAQSHTFIGLISIH